MYEHIKDFQLVYVDGVGYFLLQSDESCISKAALKDLQEKLNKSFKNHTSGEVNTIIRDYNKFLKSQENKRRIEFAKKQKEICGYDKVKGAVYFLKSETGIFKIGMSKNVDNRIKSLKAAFPFKVELFRKVEHDDIRRIEKEAHKYFKDKNIYGEWFDITEEEINKWIGGLTRG